MSDEMKTCPACDNPYGYYVSDEQYACPECGNEWNPTEAKEEEKGGSLVVKDSNGNLLQDGDSVVV
ncbi:MAG: alkylphosphonate utilization protein, partial [Flavobacteriales bacterium]|nr:alkylphosphonate utilization protein [Flavobacteriales bacterium]